MSELSLLLDALDSLQAQGQDAVLATVVKVEGSAYRRPGARMLIPRLGTSVGTVSGGCLEGDVAKKAWWLTDGGEAVLRRYSTGDDDGDDDEETELAFGLGCNGTVHILLERLPAGDRSLPVELLRQVHARQRPAVLATVIGGSAARLGERFALDPDGCYWSASAEGPLAEALKDALPDTLRRGRSALCQYRLADGLDAEVFLEYLPAPRRLVVFGAGHDVQPLVSMAAAQGWRTCVVDARAHFARPERFPDAERVLWAPLDRPFESPGLLDGAAVAVMTHSYSQDRHWLELALGRSPAYLGQLGPRNRTERLLGEMAPSARRSPAFARLHYPIGLDIGGDTPETVALAILAEIAAVFARRNGAMLMTRQGAIHTPEVALRRYLDETPTAISQ